MARRSRKDRNSSTLIWPGFVDAMTALLLVVMFVLSIFMIVQFVLREELTGKDRSLAELSAQLGVLSDELSVARSEASSAEDRARSLDDLLALERAKVTELRNTLAIREEQGRKLADELSARLAELTVVSEALEARREEVDKLGALAAGLREERDAAKEALADSGSAAELADENARLKAQAAEIRRRLAEAAGQDPDSAALTLDEQIAALELMMQKRRKEAEDTLALLAAAEAKNKELTEEAKRAAQSMTREERLAALARASLAEERDISEQGRLAVALLNSQVRALRGEIAALRLKLDAADAREAADKVEIANLGERLNRALADRVSELERYRSEFFGRLREVLGERDDVRVVGDRFVFQSEVLFDSGSAELGPEGKAELARFAGLLREVAREIPEEINWILRVDGHTDRVPLGPNSEYASNWQLSQARALSVVTYLIDEQSFPPSRLAAVGFGEYQPIDTGRSREALARNRRIELKLTER